MRLIDSSGNVLASPTNLETAFVITHSGNIQRTHYHVSASLDDFVLPSDGTYYVELSGGVGQYWLGIGDPQVHPLSISATDALVGVFGTQDDSQELSFNGIAGQPIGWNYDGRAIEGWEVFDSHGTRVASGAGGTKATIKFTPQSSGQYLLRFEDQRSAITGPGHVGPFMFELQPAEVTSPRSNIRSAVFNQNLHQIAIELAFVDEIGYNRVDPSGVEKIDVFVSVDGDDFEHWSTVFSPSDSILFMPESNKLYWFVTIG